MKSIRIIATGGTFEKEYDEIKGALVIRKTHIPRLLRKARCRLPISLKVISKIDSLYMDNGLRERILEECRKSKERKIVIIHGTDTLAKTARLLGANIHDKTIILTGSLIPSTFPYSDADFNLGSALAFAQCMENGVYVAMNGQLFPWNDVRKILELGVFGALSPKTYK